MPLLLYNLLTLQTLGALVLETTGTLLLVSLIVAAVVGDVAAVVVVVITFVAVSVVSVGPEQPFVDVEVPVFGSRLVRFICCISSTYSSFRWHDSVNQSNNLFRNVKEIFEKNYIK